MRTFLVRFFALDYITKLCGYKINFTRSATVIYPLFVICALLILSSGITALSLFFIGLFILSLITGFVYFRVAPVKWYELDKVQLFQYEKAQKMGIFFESVTEKYRYIQASDFANSYVRERIERRNNYKPYLFIFHPVVMVILSITATVLILY